jgi:copper transport protein
VSRWAIVVAVLAAALLSVTPTAAMGHAVVEGTSPLSGETVKRQPSQIEFRYSEPVEGNFGAIRVFDSKSRRVDSGESFHPDGQGSRLAVRLKPDLPKGTYTATYRVISADSHPVSGGFVFSIGRASASGATVSDLLKDRGGTGDVTEFFFGVTRTLQYAATAIGIGAVFFLLAIWLPALASVAGAGAEWSRASEQFARRLSLLLALAVGVGVVSSALGIVFQGATAAGTSFWSALDWDVIDEVLGTRFGTVWGIRLLVWLALGGLLVAAFSGARRPVLRPASVGATGLALGRPGLGSVTIAVLLLPLAFLAIAPALAGHASLQDPTAVLFPANVVHVIAMSIWSAGLVTLVVALPAATRQLERSDRSRLLAANLVRFSNVAAVCVAAILITGVLQAWFEIGSWSALWDTKFAAAVLIKAGLLLLPLAALGAYNRRRLVPELRRIADGAGTSPGRTGVLLRRSLLTEIALIAVVLGVTSALVSYPPPDSFGNASGPFAETTSLGPADLQLTVDPARVGANVIHVYLTDKRTGTQWDQLKEFKLSASLPKQDIGPVALDTRKAGPGHFVANGATFGAAGDWELSAEGLVSEFDAYYAKLKVPIG